MNPHNCHFPGQLYFIEDKIWKRRVSIFIFSDANDDIETGIKKQVVKPPLRIHVAFTKP